MIHCIALGVLSIAAFSVQQGAESREPTIAQIAAAFNHEATLLRSAYVRCSFETWISDIDEYPSKCLDTNQCPSTEHFAYEGLLVQSGIRRYWETYSPKRPKDHWLGWYTGERWNNYQPPFRCGNVTARPPEQYGIMPFNYFIELEGLPLSELLQKWVCEISANKRNDELGKLTLVTIRDPDPDRMRTGELYLDPQRGYAPTAVILRSGEFIVQDYRATKLEQQSNGAWLPTCVRLTAISYDRANKRPVKALLWSLSVSEASDDKSRTSRLDRLAFPVGTKVTNDLTEEDHYIGADPSIAHEEWLAALKRFQSGANESGFPWFDSAEAVAGATKEVQQKGDVEKEVKRMCGPLALSALIQSRGHSVRREELSLRALEQRCNVGTDGTRIVDLCAASKQLGCPLETISFANSAFPACSTPFIAVMKQDGTSYHYVLALPAATTTRGPWTLCEFPAGMWRVPVGASPRNWTGIGLFPTDDPQVQQWLAAATRRTTMLWGAVFGGFALAIVSGLLLLRRARKSSASKRGSSRSEPLIAGGLSILAVCAGGGCNGQGDAGASATYRNGLIHFDSATIDFGEMQVRNAEMRVVAVNNSSDVPFVIDDVKTGCSCTLVQSSLPLTIAPNGRAELQVSWSINRRQDRTQKLRVIGHFAEATVAPVEVGAELIGHPVGDIVCDPPRIVMSSEPLAGSEEKLLSVCYYPAVQDPPLLITGVNTRQSSVVVSWKADESRVLPGGDTLVMKTFVVSSKAEPKPTGSEDQIVLSVLDRRAHDIVIPVVWD